MSNKQLICRSGYILHGEQSGPSVHPIFTRANLYGHEAEQVDLKTVGRILAYCKRKKGNPSNKPTSAEICTGNESEETPET